MLWLITHGFALVVSVVESVMAVKCLVVGLVVKGNTKEAEGIEAGPLSPVVVVLQRAE